MLMIWLESVDQWSKYQSGDCVDIVSDIQVIGVEIFVLLPLSTEGMGEEGVNMMSAFSSAASWPEDVADVLCSRTNFVSRLRSLT